MPDVAYSPRDTDRGSPSASTWMYRGEPFVPSFVVEVDKLSGRGSQRSAFDRKMRNEYFQNGVKLGWLVDPRPECHAMYVYYLDNDNQVQCSANSAWRDLDGGDVLPGFRITSTSLDRVLNQDSGSSSEEEVDLTCPVRGCDQQFRALGRLHVHIEWHRAERADQKYLAKQNL
ncbi:hypothetical protein V7S43_010719 [Phytophthora oleae]|uniref:C2H2-type domain-containing protein n=1 Tax=Phytophthora oleae TaxID=2107226 RepID=A0ABD3FDN0_9STRA